MENSLEEMERRKRLIDEIKKEGESISIEKTELDQAQTDTKEQNAEYLRLKMENEDLYRQIELEENGSVRYSNDRLNRHIEMLKVNVEATCTSVHNVSDDYSAAAKKSMEMTQIWNKIVQDLPSEWFTQKDDVLQGMIDQMDDYMESCKIGFDEGRKEFSRFMEQKHSEIMECKQRHKDVQRVISELKRIIVTYNVMKPKTGTIKLVHQAN